MHDVEKLKFKESMSFIQMFLGRPFCISLNLFVFCVYNNKIWNSNIIAAKVQDPYIGRLH